MPESPTDTSEVSFSELIDKETKNIALNFGFSFDSKKVSEALGFLTIEGICDCFSVAIMRHIEFAKGREFIDDVEGFSISKSAVVKELTNFSYNFKDELKIDFDKIQLEKMEKQTEQQKEIATLKRQENFERLEQMISGDNYSNTKINEEEFEDLDDIDEEFDYNYHEFRRLAAGVRLKINP
jgi:hypothetical protein